MVSMSKTATLILVLVIVIDHANAANPPYGLLKVTGKHLTDSKGTPIQLRGLSLFWSQWSEGYPYYTAEAIKNLKKCWHVNVVRAALGIDQPGDPDGGYLSQPDREYAKLKKVIDAAIAEGIYVVVDFHDYRADQHKAQAIKFFTKIAKEYGDQPHIIYEIWNEPEGPKWPQIKAYAQELIGVIRRYDPDNVITVGTAEWDTDLESVAKSPITGRSNLVYTLHFYADDPDHQQGLRNRVQKVLDKGLPVFVTEYGTVNSDGDGAVNKAESNKWWDFLDRNKISYINWAVSQKAEGAAIFKPGTKVNQMCDKSRWTAAGNFMNAKLASIK